MSITRAKVDEHHLVKRADPTIYYIPTVLIPRSREQGGPRVEYIPELDLYLMHPNNVGVFTLMMEACNLECMQFPEAALPDEWESIPAPPDIPGMPS